MARTIDRPLSVIFAACQDYYLTNAGAKQRRGELYREVRDALTDVLHSMATIHARKYSGWKVDKKHAGYLIKFEGPMLLRVPYHAVPTFPTGDELEALWRLSRSIRSGDRSVIAISGSNVLRRIFDVVGDIDFCEYITLDKDAPYDDLAGNLDGKDDLACMSLAIGKQEWRYPWVPDKPSADFFRTTLKTNDDGASSMKVDYVGDVEKIGVTEVTNVVIALDEDGRSAALKRTFAAQEAPLVPIDWLPNQMNEPVEMGRYIHWLTSEIVKLQTKDTRKSLKRSASLARVLFIPTITDEIAALVNDNPVMLEAKIDGVKKLAASLEAFTDVRSVRLRVKLETQAGDLEQTLAKNGGAPTDLVKRRFSEATDRIVQNLLSHVRPGDDPNSRRAA